MKGVAARLAADQTLPLSARGVDWDTNYKGGRNNPNCWSTYQWCLNCITSVSNLGVVLCLNYATVLSAGSAA